MIERPTIPPPEFLVREAIHQLFLRGHMRAMVSFETFDECCDCLREGGVVILNTNDKSWKGSK